MVSRLPPRAGIKYSVRRAGHLIPCRGGSRDSDKLSTRSPLGVSAPTFFAEEKKTVGFWVILGGKRGFAGFAVLSGD